MRQAGRYLPEYRAIRSKMKTLAMMTTPEIACEITLQPVRILEVDAAILYSDILIVPSALGLKLDFVEGQGPVFENPIQSRNSLKTLNKKDLTARCPFVFETIRLIRKQIGADFPLLGFAGAPFTVGAYMIGTQGDDKGLALKKIATTDPALFQELMETLTEATVTYLQAQIKAGVDAIQLFDTWAGALSPSEYERWALPYTKTIFEVLAKVPKILYIKGGSPLFETMMRSKPDVISVDWNLPLSQARKMAKGQVALQGNLNPETLLLSIPEIEKATKAMLEDCGKTPGYIINLGHGILPNVPLENARAFVETAKKYG